MAEIPSRLNLESPRRRGDPIIKFRSKKTRRPDDQVSGVYFQTNA
eukprot:CAMPEP_0115045480 /NCGR_PEP_ID=MMETSP0216-20121206/48176_1 /TAXON_ID=223996 /ORGANISM="Protocruzia adherens, Strain Boccale" /LENGTH=44 /DNA_ID= /DNA_START= /DNA_END= /DNA_ORIENTATION=